jgi:hypothetical protein
MVGLLEPDLVLVQCWMHRGFRKVEYHSVNSLRESWIFLFQSIQEVLACLSIQLPLIFVFLDQQAILD